MKRSVSLSLPQKVQLYNRIYGYSQETFFALGAIQFPLEPPRLTERHALSIFGHMAK
jgi:hypothetical protein